VVLTVRFQIIRTREEFDQDDAGDEAAGMGPKSDPTFLLTNTYEAADDLD
jgi:hypothetical protein